MLDDVEQNFIFGHQKRNARREEGAVEKMQLCQSACWVQIGLYLDASTRWEGHARCPGSNIAKDWHGKRWFSEDFDEVYGGYIVFAADSEGQILKRRGKFRRRIDARESEGNFCDWIVKEMWQVYFGWSYRGSKKSLIIVNRSYERAQEVAPDRAQSWAPNHCVSFGW